MLLSTDGAHVTASIYEVHAVKSCYQTVVDVHTWRTNYWLLLLNFTKSSIRATVQVYSHHLYCAQDHLFEPYHDRKVCCTRAQHTPDFRGQMCLCIVRLRVWVCPNRTSNTFSAVLVLANDLTPCHTTTEMVWTTHIMVRWAKHSKRSHSTVVIRNSHTEKKSLQGQSCLHVTPDLFFL